MKRLLPHQQRVIDDHHELKAKTNRLRDFITDQFSQFPNLNVNEQSRLRTQLAIMDAYESILEERIKHF